MNCNNCGNKIDGNSKFCPKCGSAVNLEQGKGTAIASLVIGIISLLTGGFILPLPIVGLILGISYKGKCGEKTAGIILNTISLVLAVLVIILGFVFGIVFGSRILNDAIDRGIDNIDFNEMNIDMNTDFEKYKMYIDSNDELDSTTNIVGTWKELSNDRSLYRFTDEEYYYYKDINNLESKYDTGKYNIQDGMEELKNMGIDNKLLNKFMDKLMRELENTSFSFLNFDSVKSYANGVEVKNNYTEEDLYKAVVITTHDNVVELIISGTGSESEKHFYKIKENN